MAFSRSVRKLPKEGVNCRGQKKFSLIAFALDDETGPSTSVLDNRHALDQFFKEAQQWANEAKLKEKKKRVFQGKKTKIQPSKIRLSSTLDGIYILRTEVIKGKETTQISQAVIQAASVASYPVLREKLVSETFSCGLSGDAFMVTVVKGDCPSIAYASEGQLFFKKQLYPNSPGLLVDICDEAHELRCVAGVEETLTLGRRWWLAVSSLTDTNSGWLGYVQNEGESFSLSQIVEGNKFIYVHAMNDHVLAVHSKGVHGYICQPGSVDCAFELLCFNKRDAIEITAACFDTKHSVVWIGTNRGQVGILSIARDWHLAASKLCIVANHKHSITQMTTDDVYCSVLTERGKLTIYAFSPRMQGLKRKSIRIKSQQYKGCFLNAAVYKQHIYAIVRGSSMVRVLETPFIPRRITLDLPLIR